MPSPILSFCRVSPGCLRAVRLKACVLFLMMGLPILSAMLILNQEVRLAPLEGIDGVCSQCDQKATRTLARAAVSLRDRGLYKYKRNDNAGTMPIWCNRHGPDKSIENATKAYVVAIATFAFCAVVYKKFPDV